MGLFRSIDRSAKTGGVKGSAYRRSPPPTSLLQQEKRLAKLFLAPAITLIFVVYVLPTVVTLVISFEPAKTDPRLAQVFGREALSNLGIGNYQKSAADPIWLKAIGNTAFYTFLVLLLGMSLSLAIAMLLTQPFRGRGFLRALILIPWAVPPIVNGTTWGLVFHADIGTVNGMLRSIGLIQRDLLWLGDPRLALITIVTATTWRLIPFMSLLILAGLQTISQELYESAEVDGAGGWQRFRYITLPGIWPVLLTVATLQIIWTTKSFDEIWALTKGGPSYGTVVMNLWVYRQAFEFLNFGYGSALAYILTALTVGVVLGNYLLNRRIERR